MADLPPGKGGGPSVRKALRVPNELEERVNAARGDVSWSRWVLRAVEQRLEREGAREPLPPLSAAEKAAVANIGEMAKEVWSAPADESITRAQEQVRSSWDAAAMERQAKLNKAKGL